MPNMDYPGPCLSCISDSCGLWDENYSERNCSDNNEEHNDNNTNDQE